MLNQTVKLNDNGSAKVCGGNTELRFGYVKNENIYSVNFELSPEWEGLYIRVFWHVPEGDDPSSSLVVDGSVTVPPAVTAITGVGKITLEGTDGTKTITSSDVTYRVYENSGISDGTDPELGSSAWEQFVNEVKADADRAEASAAVAKQSEANAKASETASKLSETNSSASAAAAKQSEANAKASETEATKQAGIASEKANSASASADAAKLSETEAAKQAEIALQHANTSKENADSSSKNASLASASAAAAKQSETASATSEANSKTSETNAKRSETASASSAAAAKQSETASATSEANSKTSENKSLEYMNAAKGYSESASSSAASSEASYRNALKSAQDAAGHASSALSSENESARILGEVKNTASTAQDELNAAKNNYLTELSDAKASHISSMETKASELTEASKKDIESAKETAINEIAATNKKLPDITAEDAGKSLLVSEDGTEFVLGDPPVVSYTKEESDARYAPIESAIRPTANGNPAVCEDSIAWSFQGLKVYGKSTQDGTPSPGNPVPIISAGEGGSVALSVTGANFFDIALLGNGIVSDRPEVTASVDGNVLVVSGKGIYQGNQEVNYSMPKNLLFLPAGVYCISFKSDFLYGTGSSGGYKTVEIYVFSDNQVLGTTGNNGYFSFTLTKTENIYFRFDINNDTISAKFYDIMINAGSEPLPFAPYTNQSLSLSTPSGLPGIPVESGGNYTDASGQQRICDVVDLGLNSITKSCYYKTIQKADFLAVVNFTDYNRFMFRIKKIEESDYVLRANIPAICDRFENDTKEIVGHFNIKTAADSGWSGYARAFFYVPLDVASIDDFMAYVDNDLAVIMADPYPETQSLLSEEIAAYRALQTYPGITVVSTAEPVAGIEAQYVVNPQKYIEKYVDEKVSAAVSEAVTSAITLMQGGI